MRILVYIGVALWIGAGVVIFVWNMILDAQMMNNIVPKPYQSRLYRPRRFTFQTDPADYTELGQLYRQKPIRASPQGVVLDAAFSHRTEGRRWAEPFPRGQSAKD